jgi:cytochrome P450
LGCGAVPVYPHRDPILGLDSFFEGIRAIRNHRLLDFYAGRFESCAPTYYSLTLGKWFLMTMEVENIKTVLGTNMDDWPIDGPRLYATLPVLGPDSIFTSNGEAWHKARAMLRPSFVRDQVADLRCFDRHIRNMLAAVPGNGTTFDMQDLLRNMAMDSSTDFLLGYSTNLLVKPSPEAEEFVHNFEYASKESAKKALLGPVLYHLPHPKLRRAVHGLREFVRFYMKKAVAEGGQKGAQKERDYVFLDELLKANPPEEYTIDQILSVLIAGRDTTATAMTAAFYFLARDPAAVQKLRAEIKAVNDGDPTWEQLKQMRYLNNVIKEGKSSTPFTLDRRLKRPRAVHILTANASACSPASLHARGNELKDLKQGNHPPTWRRQGWQATSPGPKGNISAMVASCPAP